MSTSTPASPPDPADLARRLRFARRLNLVLAAAVGLLLVLLAGVGLPGLTTTSPAAGQPGAGQPTASGTPTATTTPQGEETVRVVRRDPSDLLAIGAVDAPVVLVEWADLRCPYCAAFTTTTLPALIEQYVASGRVRIEFNDVSLFGEQSTQAAMALRAAAEQGRFEEFLGAVHAAAPASGHADLPPERLLELARTAGVPDLARFEDGLERADLREAVEASTAWAQELGISSVPFFVVGNQAIRGAQPLEVFQQVLDAALAQAGA